MQRAFLPFSLLLALVLGVSSNAQATALARPVTVKDTIVVRLPNKAVITLMVRDAAQLRQLKKYQLDSLTSRLATYITQAEAAAKTASTNQVTMEFYPDKDQPGKNMPEQIRITTHKTAAGAASNNKVDVMMDKASKNTGVSFKIGGKTEEERRTRAINRDSVRQKNFENHHSKSHLIFDLGLNALVNQKTYLGLNGQPETVDLRTEGSRYVNIGLNWDPRLGGKHSPVSLTVGPEFAFNNYMLSGNNKWVNVNGRTAVVHETNGRQYQKTKLATSSINLPLMLRLQLRDSHYRPTFLLSAGGFAGYRIKSWTKLKYTSEGTTYKDKEDGSYNMENFLYGLQGTIGYGDLEFFAKYNMNPLFKTGAGPDTQVLSFGLRLIGVN
ncbi:PorT family protein [Hymenobacter sp. DH14]|uniref:PorT family protein n=1 Tax=Hymenobacter cyanobacteriorum TaxID=2926463 RepID=A0A9X2AHI6_9BACT|nr:outer membrane beta-barrel protein [Hymenobacter cyanobacteriorum]MCI1187570.1 PorT family protein [Hymenobacter cyanobacteriorum]